jgi:hypothetical protein
MSKTYTLKQLVDYRNKILIRAKARTKQFNDNKQNYYWYRLAEIESQIGISQSIGSIVLK